MPGRAAAALPIGDAGVGRAEAATAAQQRTGLPAEGNCASHSAAGEQLFLLQSMKYLQNKLLECAKEGHRRSPPGINEALEEL